MTNEHTSLKKYTSHTLFEMVVKGLYMRGELETGQTATFWPKIPLSLAALLSRWLTSCSIGVLRAQPSARSWFSLPRTATNWLQLTEPVCGTGLYNCLTSTCFLWSSHLHPIQPVHCQSYTLISSTGCTCYLPRCISYLTARLRVNMLHLLHLVGLKKRRSMMTL